MKYYTYALAMAFYDDDFNQSEGLGEQRHDLFQNRQKYEKDTNDSIFGIERIYTTYYQGEKFAVADHVRALCDLLVDLRMEEAYALEPVIQSRIFMLQVCEMLYSVGKLDEPNIKEFFETVYGDAFGSWLVTKGLI